MEDKGKNDSSKTKSVERKFKTITQNKTTVSWDKIDENGLKKHYVEEKTVTAEREGAEEQTDQTK